MVPTTPTDPEVGTLRHYVGVLWRRRWALLAPIVVVPVVTLVATLSQAPVHEASAEVLINRQEIAATSLVGETPALDDASRSIETQARLARIPDVVDQAVAAAGVEGLSRNDLLVSSSVFPTAGLLTFVVEDEDPETAALLASEYARQFAEYRRELDTRALIETLADLRSDIAELEASGETGTPLYASLVDKEQTLRALETLSTSNVFVVRTAEASDTEQVAPRPLRNTALAVVAGVLGGLVLAFLWEALDTRVRRPEDVESLLGLPLLARLPDPRRHGGARIALLDPAESPEAEAHHALRLSLEFANADLGARTILVTSAGERDGKTRVAANLAVGLARAGRRVALVDLDLRDPVLTRVFGLETRAGATTVCLGRSTPEHALVRVPLGQDEGSGHPETNGHGELDGMLEVMGAGPLPPRPTELLASRTVEGLLATLASRADTVVVDGPLALAGAEATALADKVEAVLLVVGLRSARRKTLAELGRVLSAWPAAKLGFALTAGASAGRRGRPLPGESSAPAQPIQSSERMTGEHETIPRRRVGRWR
jgi:Mrp family chromosome partitioning ATPase